MYSLLNCIVRRKINKIHHKDDNLIKQNIDSTSDDTDNDKYLVDNDLLCVICLTDLSLKKKQNLKM